MAIHACSTPAPAVQPGLLPRRADGAPPPLLPRLAALPALPAAFSRRAALFGAVASTGFLAAAERSPGSIAALAPADARLVALAEEATALFRHRQSLLGDDPAYAAAIDRECDIEVEVAALQASTSAALEAKARVLLVPSIAEADTHGIGVSLARDLLRLAGRA